MKTSDKILTAAAVLAAAGGLSILIILFLSQDGQDSIQDSRGKQAESGLQPEQGQEQVHKEQKEEEPPGRKKTGTPDNNREKGYSQAVVDDLARRIEDRSIDPATLSSLTQSTEERVRAVMKVAAGTSPVQSAAIRALETVRDRSLHSAVEKTLLQLTDHRNTAVALTAVESLGKLRKDAAVPHLKMMIRQKYGKGDQSRVCRAAVASLGHIASKTSLDVLLDQLQRVDEPKWMYDYGSAVIKALADHDKRVSRPHRRERTDQGQNGETAGLSGKYRKRISDALLEYAGELEKRLPSIPNRASREYLKAKIREAREAAALQQEDIPEQG